MEFIPNNLLEKSLVAASSDAAHRHQFYKDLIESDFFIIQEGKIPETHGRTTLSQDQELKIQNIELNGKPYVPVFSSLPRLQAVLDREVGYIALNALELMKIVLGSEIILNPGSPYGKEFVKDEIASIVDGSIFQPSERFVAQKDTQVLLGQPANYPQELVDALSRYFKTRKEVKNAYLAHFHNPERDEKAHTLIGVDVEGNWNDIMSGAGMIVGNVEVPDPPVDFVQITGNGGIEDYLTSNCKPFYKRKRFGLF